MNRGLKRNKNTRRLTIGEHQRRQSRCTKCEKVRPLDDAKLCTKCAGDRRAREETDAMIERHGGPPAPIDAADVTWPPTDESPRLYLGAELPEDPTGLGLGA